MVVWVVISGAAMLAGCGDDDSKDGDPVEIGPVETGPIECELPALPEAAHEEEIRVVTELPTGAGGALRDGTYDLVGHIRYRMMASSNDDPTFMRAALRLRRNGTVMDYLFDEGAAGETPDPRGFTASVMPSGGVLVVDQLCPDREPWAVGYTASGDSFSLIEENEEMRFERK